MHYTVLERLHFLRELWYGFTGKRKPLWGHEYVLNIRFRQLRLVLWILVYGWEGKGLILRETTSKKIVISTHWLCAPTICVFLYHGKVVD